VIQSALHRRESRGLHFNLDCPQASDAWKCDTVIKRGAIRDVSLVG
jgi:aspartate oxidase